MTITLPAPLLTDYLARIYRAAGSPEDEARIVAEHLVEANLKGHDSHGVIRTSGYLLQIRNGVAHPGAPTRVLEDAPSMAVLDGGWNLGQVVATRATEMAITKARETGVALVTCINTMHAGRVGAYGEQIVRAGMAAMGGVNTPGARLVAAFGGGHRRTGTNPLMFAFPGETPETPFVLDMATSVVAEGKLKVAVNKGAEVPEAWILDGDGKPSIQPRDFYGTGDNEKMGTLLPVGGAFSGYKGFGLNLAVETLGGVLSGAGTSVAGTRGTNGVFIMAIDVAHFTPLAAFTSLMAGLGAHVKEPPYQPGVSEVLLPGEPERRTMAQRLRDGVSLDDETWKQTVEAAAALGVGPLELPPL
jgi:uncharacterized oxidoreductase